MEKNIASSSWSGNEADHGAGQVHGLTARAEAGLETEIEEKHEPLFVTSINGGYFVPNSIKLGSDHDFFSTYMCWDDP